MRTSPRGRRKGNPFAGPPDLPNLRVSGGWLNPCSSSRWTFLTGWTIGFPGESRSQIWRSFTAAICREVGNRRSEGIALGSLATLYWTLGRIEQAERIGREALAIHREVGDRRSEGILLGLLASLYEDTGRVELAERTRERALSIHRSVGNRRHEALTLCSRATLSMALGRIEEARQAWIEGKTLLLELGDTHNLNRKAVDMRNACAAAGVPPFNEVQA